MSRSLIAAALAAFVGAGFASSALSQTKPDVQVKQRQSVMMLQSKYFGQINLMASGKVPFDSNVAARNAAFLDALAKMPWDNFTADTQPEKSRAMPEIYKDSGKFKEAQERFMGDVSKLVASTKSGEAGFKAAAADVAKSCNGCHEAFRSK